MSNAQVVIELALPSDELLRRYPLLRNVNSTKLRLIEDALAAAARKSDFAPSRFSEAETREAVEFYNHVVRDGRYVGILGTDPAGAAKLLDVPLSDKVKDILAYAKFIAPGVPIEDSQGGDYAIAIGISVAVSIVVLAVGPGGPALVVGLVVSAPQDGPETAQQGLVILDRSGQIKL